VLAFGIFFFEREERGAANSSGTEKKGVRPSVLLLCERVGLGAKNKKKGPVRWGGAGGRPAQEWGGGRGARNRKTKKNGWEGKGARTQHEGARGQRAPDFFFPLRRGVGVFVFPAPGRGARCSWGVVWRCGVWVCERGTGSSKGHQHWEKQRKREGGRVPAGAFWGTRRNKTKTNFSREETKQKLRRPGGPSFSLPCWVPGWEGRGTWGGGVSKRKPGGCGG